MSDFLSRLVPIAAAVGFCLVQAGNALASGLPLLKPAVTVNGSSVTLGDLFSNAGDKADVVVTHAPKPGEQGTVALAEIANAARLANFLWRHNPETTRVAVRRSSQVVAQSAIDQAVAAALIKWGLPGPIEVLIRTPGLEFHVAVDRAPTIVVRDVDVNATNGNFSASLFVQTDDAPANPLRIAGQAFSQTRVPVLARPIVPGEAIGKNDVSWQLLRTDRIPTNVAVSIEQLVGHTPRRPVSVGEPVRVSDLETPVMIAKGAMVTMEVTAGRMQLTAAGQALESGAQGALIRVTNVKSRRTVHATVLGPNRVSVAYLPNEVKTGSATQ